jgi:hypothetical protein
MTGSEKQKKRGRAFAFRNMPHGMLKGFPVQWMSPIVIWHEVPTRSILIRGEKETPCN